MSDREVTAYHEAAHTIAAVRMGKPVNVVSIRACDPHLGVVLADPLPVDEAEFGKLGAMVPMLPDGLRRALEADVIVLLAGFVGELLTCRSGFGEADGSADELLALEKLERLSSPTKPSSLDPHERRLLAASERGPTGEGDDVNAARTAFALSGDQEEAAAYLRWLRVVTARLVWTPSFIEAVERLVPPLLEHEVLGGRQVGETILEGEPDGVTRTYETLQA